MAPTDPTAGEAPRDRLNIALGLLMQRYQLTARGAYRLLTEWARVTGMIVHDLADLILTEARVRTTVEED